MSNDGSQFPHWYVAVSDFTGFQVHCSFMTKAATDTSRHLKSERVDFLHLIETDRNPRFPSVIASSYLYSTYSHDKLRPRIAICGWVLYNKPLQRDKARLTLGDSPNDYIVIIPLYLLMDNRRRVTNVLLVYCLLRYIHSRISFHAKPWLAPNVLCYMIGA